MPACHQAILWSFTLATPPRLPATAEIKLTATRSLAIQPAGARQCEAGSHYFNIEGVKKGRYASYCVLIFELPKGGDQASDGEKLRVRQGRGHPSLFI